MNWEKVFTVHVAIEKTVSLQNKNGDSVVMITFAGDVTGKYFNGIVLDGGVDTQIIGKFGDRHSLSARYMLQGTDYTGKTCEIYIENKGNMQQQKTNNRLFRTSPRIITNSEALDFLNGDVLVGEGIQTESGIDIIIYRAQ